MRDVPAHTNKPNTHTHKQTHIYTHTHTDIPDRHFRLRSLRCQRLNVPLRFCSAAYCDSTGFHPSSVFATQTQREARLRQRRLCDDDDDNYDGHRAVTTITNANDDDDDGPANDNDQRRRRQAGTSRRRNAHETHTIIYTANLTKPIGPQSACWWRLVARSLATSLTFYHLDDTRARA